MTEHTDHTELRKAMLQHKTFLKKLHDEKKGYANKRSIAKASEPERKVLLNVLYCICQGHVPIKKNHFTNLIKSKRKLRLQSLGKTYERLATASKEDQIKYLKQFSSLYSQLLYPLFNK